MEYVLIIGLPLVIGAYYVVKRLIAKSYHRGWFDGYADCIDDTYNAKLEITEEGEAD